MTDHRNDRRFDDETPIAPPWDNKYRFSYSYSLFSFYLLLQQFLQTCCYPKPLANFALTLLHMPSIDTPPDVGPCLGPSRLSTSLLVARAHHG